MKFGMVYPQTEFGNDPGAIRDFAQTAEGLGFAHVLAFDHVLGANPDRPGGWQGMYTYKHAFQEPLVLFSYMAALTQKLEFTTSIIILPQRQTALFAKQAATLDVLSGGRLRLGIGLGSNQVEYTALGENFHNRGRRSEEQVELLRRLWTEPLVDFEGSWHRIPDAGLNPLPLQRPIPIWFGGHADAMLRRMARLGDGWMPTYRKASDAQSSLEQLERYLAEAGRNRYDFGLEVRLLYGEGDPDAWKSAIREWKPAGVTHFSFNTMGRGLATPQEHLSAMQRIAQALDLAPA